MNVSAQTDYTNERIGQTRMREHTRTRGTFKEKDWDNTVPHATTKLANIIARKGDSTELKANLLLKESRRLEILFDYCFKTEYHCEGPMEPSCATEPNKPLLQAQQTFLCFLFKGSHANTLHTLPYQSSQTVCVCVCMTVCAVYLYVCFPPWAPHAHTHTRSWTWDARGFKCDTKERCRC